MMSPELSRELARIYNDHAADPRVSEIRSCIGLSHGRLSRLPAPIVATLLDWGLPKRLIKEDTTVERPGSSGETEGMEAQEKLAFVKAMEKVRRP